MATYLQWNRKRPLRRVTWVCGPEDVLVREVVAAHRDGEPPDQCAALFAGEAPEHEVWDALLTDPPPGGRRAVVYGAERLRDVSNAALLAADPGLEAAYVVFVSADPDFPREGSALVPHLAALQASRAAQLIRCCEPSKTEDKTALVASWWPGATPNFAYGVLARCGSLERAYQACEQARLAGLEPSRAMAAVVCPAEPGGNFADLLMAGNKRGACTVIGQLIYGTRHGLTPREAATREHVDRFVASRVIPHVGAYTADRIRRCRQALATAESAWRGGTRAGVAESLIALW